MPRLPTPPGPFPQIESDSRNCLKSGDQITREVSLRLADNKELGILFINHANNFLALAERSPYTAEQPDRLETLRMFVDPNHLFGLKDLKALLDMFFEDMAASREKVVYTGKMVDRSGNETRGEIIRLGHLPALYFAQEHCGYLSLSPASGRLIMGPSPSWRVRRNLCGYFEGKTESVYTDISGGSAIQQLAHRVTLMDQLRSGGGTCHTDPPGGPGGLGPHHRATHISGKGTPQYGRPHDPGYQTGGRRRYSGRHKGYESASTSPPPVGC